MSNSRYIAPKSVQRKALHYLKENRHYLTNYLKDDRLELINNRGERRIKPFVIDLNWLFCDTVKGAESSAIVYSLVETAKANGIDPYDYLFYTLSVLLYFGKSSSHERLETLMPWADEMQQRYNEKLQSETE